MCVHKTAAIFSWFNLASLSLLYTGRKRPMEQFGGDSGGSGDLGPDFQKKGRFDNLAPQDDSELDQLDVPPATMRILVRQIDAGGIIGKVWKGLKLPELCSLAPGKFEILGVGRQISKRVKDCAVVWR